MATPEQANNATDANTSPRATRSFDPFAPLPSSQPSPSNVIKAPSLASSSQPAPSSSFAAHSDSPSLSRAHRPPSLYVPMDDSSNPLAPNTATPATWPFEGRAANGIRSDSLAVASPAIVPQSPSQIHPSYADSPSAAALHQLPPPSDAPPHRLHSTISMAAAGGSVAYTSSSSRGLPRSPSPNYGFKGRDAGHGANLSVGTHSLLSSRQLTGPPTLAQRLDTPVAWLALYFAFNLGLTLFNKLVLQGFPFPWTLTAIQMLSGTIGTQIALHRGVFTQARLTTKENGIMVMFSGLYTINIAVSNLSLHLVSVPFHQVVRAMTPLFTIVLTTIVYHKRHSRQTYLALVPVVAGVVFATYGDYSFTPWGFILTLLGTFLAALKTIITNRVQVGRLKLHPLDLLVRMSPLAFMQCVFFGWWSGELDRVREYGATEMTQRKAIALAMNGAIAFGLNVVSFTANKKTSALTMTPDTASSSPSLPNVKQVLTIVLAVVIFNVSLNPTNLLGISLTLLGGAWYAKVELQEKTARAAAAQSAAT
ncbi:hypothetical protein JCM3770_005036 [Rhodotorula araucariae]